MSSRRFSIRRAPADRGAQFARALSRLYIGRAGLSLVWVTVLALLVGPSGWATSFTPQVRTWLVLYPLGDAIATAFDLRATPQRSHKLIQQVNVITSLFAAAALLGASPRNSFNPVRVFGVWAVVAGVIQLLVAVRRNSASHAHWLMGISRGGSVLAGITFLSDQGVGVSGASVLIQYSTGGALWYVLAAIWLGYSAWRSPRKQSALGHTHVADLVGRQPVIPRAASMDGPH